MRAHAWCLSIPAGEWPIGADSHLERSWWHREVAWHSALGLCPRTCSEVGVGKMPSWVDFCLGRFAMRLRAEAASCDHSKMFHVFMLKAASKPTAWCIRALFLDLHVDPIGVKNRSVLSVVLF